MDYGRTELADRLAAEYAAGLLRGAARRRFEALLPAHASLRAALRDWQQRLMPLAAQVPEQAPPPRVWRRIEAKIAPAVGVAAQAQRSGSARLAFWRGLSAFATVAAIGLAVLLANPRAQAPIVVVLSAADGEAGAPALFVASFSADGRAVSTRPLQSVSVEPGRALELWAVPAKGAPRSLGLISAQGTSVVKRTRILKDTTALAVSLEPTGGSPTGAPTGPILYVGKLTL